MDLDEFCFEITRLELSPAEKGLAILWWHHKSNPELRLTASAIAKVMRSHGLGNPSLGRLSQQLVNTGDVLRSLEGFRLKPSRVDSVSNLLPPTFQDESELSHTQRFISDSCDQFSHRKSRIFIGHGSSLVWRELKDFLEDRLELDWEEFNRESQAGRSTKERLQELVSTCNFAFLVLTGDDLHGDEKKHARESVIHEVGLFQGALGFHRAIVLKEDGCEEFSNIRGLTQIRFPKGRIRAAFEDIRDVLEREELVAHAVR